MNGRAYPFPGGIANSFMAVSGDAHGSMIEVYPEDVGAAARRRRRAGQRGPHAAAPAHVPFHLLLSVPVDRDTVQRIGEREGWRTRLFGRGAPGQPPAFHVIEFWIENRLMVEVATPDMLAEYTGIMRPEKLDAVFPARSAV